MTIEEIKKALQKEAKMVRKQLGITGNDLKVTCNVKQMANGEFTIFSRHMEKYKDIIMGVGSKFGEFIGIEESWVDEHRMRFKANVTETQEEPTGAQEEPVTPQMPEILTQAREEATETVKKPQPHKKMSQKMFDALNEARVNMRIRHDLGPQVVDFVHEKSNNEQFVVVLYNTEQQHGLMMLEDFKHLGEITKVVKYDRCVEYTFRAYGAPYRRPSITMDLRGLPYPEEAKADDFGKPLAEAKKDILKFADKLRKQHGIPGLDFRIICTDTHIAIDEFILYTKSDQDYGHLRSEFDRFGHCYKTESAGKGATRFRFHYKCAN